MRLGTFNVLGLTGYPPQFPAGALAAEPERVAHFAAVFAGLGCDVLALQEGPDPATMRRIAERLGAGLAAFPSPSAYPGYILSRLAIRESRVYAHMGPGGPDGPFSRSAGAALLGAPGAEPLWVVAVHLHPSDAGLRLRETGLLAAHLDRLDGPAVVLGDFNSEVGEPVHAMLQARGFVHAALRAGRGIEATMDTAGVRPRAIDHIYVDARMAGRVASARVVRDEGFRADAQAPGRWVHSDHLPVTADLAEP